MTIEKIAKLDQYLEHPLHDEPRKDCSLCFGKLQEEIKGESYYVNQCHSGNRVKRTEVGRYGHFTSFHKVEDKIVELRERVVAEQDDVSYELDEVIIHDKMPSYA